MSDATNANNGQVELDPFSQEAHETRLKELDQAQLPTDTNFLLLWDTLTHCAEPGDGHIVLEKLGVVSEKVSLEKKEQEAADKEFAQDIYRVKFDGHSYPERHHTWPADFQLFVDKEEYFFYVLKDKDSKPDEDIDAYNTKIAPGDIKTRIAEFGLRYHCGKKARDANGNLIGEVNKEIEFNFAEHKMMGEMLTLRWSSSETTSGKRELKLPNGVKLGYGDINGLGGDYFGGYNPVCTGKNFDQQCQYFMEAFNTLGQSGKALDEVSKLLETRAEEVNAIVNAVKDGKSTFEAYKGLNKPVGAGLTQDDIKTTLITMKGEGPSYLRLAQINLDHFGEDAKLAYNAGHYCALKKAAEGDLETAYAMNAFADHYLGDCFASGHFRTPRRVLHGSDSAFGAGWAAISGVVQNVATGHFLKFYQGAMKVMVPDLCAMLMHNEDNKLGITVTNRRGQRFACWGDKQMFEPQNKDNLGIMREGLQASVDEVYAAFESKRAPRPDEGEGYRAWLYAPDKVDEAASHSPLFVKYTPSRWTPWKWGVKVRKPFDQPWSREFVEVGGSANLIELYNKISGSELWKTY